MATNYAAVFGIMLPAINMGQAAVRSWATNRWDLWDDYADMSNLWGLKRQLNDPDANRWAGAILTNVGAAIAGAGIGAAINYSRGRTLARDKLLNKVAENQPGSVATTVLGGQSGGDKSMMGYMLMSQILGASQNYASAQSTLTDEQLAALLNVGGGGMVAA